MHLPAYEVKFYGIVQGGYMELLSSLYHYCCRTFPCITDGVGQEELLQIGLPPEEEASTLCSLIWCDKLLLHSPNAHHNSLLRQATGPSTCTSRCVIAVATPPQCPLDLGKGTCAHIWDNGSSHGL